MHVDLDINHHVTGKSIYRPGDTIQGKVTVYELLHNDCSVITIHLNGSADVSLAGSYIHTTTLCNEVQVIPGKTVRQQLAGGNRVDVPFSIKMPEYANSCNSDLSSMLPWTLHQHELPPSMEAHRFDYSSCKIYYSLEAKLERAGHYSSSARAGEMLIVRGSRRPSDEPFEIEYNSMTKTLSHRTPDVSLIEMLLFGKKQTISIQAIDIIAKIPLMMDLGNKIPIFMHFKPNALKSIMAGTPEV